MSLTRVATPTRNPCAPPTVDFRAGRALVAIVAVAARAACPTGSADLTARHALAPPGKRVMKAACGLPPRYVARISRGFFPGRSPNLLFVPRKPHLFGTTFVTTNHSGPWDFMQKVPLVFYGPGILRPRGPVAPRPAPTSVDIAPTVARLLETRLPPRRPGRVIEAVRRAVVPGAKPRLVVTVVWDGGGWNALRQWPRAWPFLHHMSRAGVAVSNATVGTSPSVTPAVHATIGTGSWPREHGIADIRIRDGVEFVDSFRRMSPRRLRIPTLADLYDLRTGNDARVALLAERPWHLGMMGHGSYLRTGHADRDVAAVYGERGRLDRASPAYSHPGYLQSVPGLDDAVRTVDLIDGRLDGRWLERYTLQDRRSIVRSPAWLPYHNRLLDSLISEEALGQDDVTDLLFTNYKQIDLIGHASGMLDVSMKETIRATDEAVRGLTHILDRRVGPARWVIVLTADHGLGLVPSAVDGWPIDIEELQRFVEQRFASRSGDLVEEARPVGLWLDRSALRAGISIEDVASSLLTYTLRDNAGSSDIPAAYEDDVNARLFEAAFPAGRLSRVRACVSK